MKVLVLFLITFFLSVFDVSLMPFFDFKGFYPSLLSLYFFVYSMNSEKYNIVYFSVLVGFFQDLFFFNGFGINIFLNLVMGLSLFYLSIKYNKSKYILSVLIVVSFAVLKNIFISLYMNLFFNVNFVLIKFVYDFLYTFTLMLLLYPIFNNMFKSKLFRKGLEF